MRLRSSSWTFKSCRESSPGSEDGKPVVPCAGLVATAHPVSHRLGITLLGQWQFFKQPPLQGPAYYLTFRCWMSGAVQGCPDVDALSATILKRCSDSSHRGSHTGRRSSGSFPGCRQGFLSIRSSLIVNSGAASRAMAVAEE